MPFSSVLGASSVIKPGVVTSATRPSAPYVGQLIFETDTNRLAVYNGSSWIMLADADTPPGLELVKTQTIGTAVSSITVTDAFSATYDNYKIIISGGAHNSGGANLGLRLGSTATGYYSLLMYATYATASYVGDPNSNGTFFEYIGDASTDGLFTNIDLFSPFAAKWTRMNSLGYQKPGEAGWSTGNLQNTTSYTEFTILVSGGTVTGGTIRVYGYRNS